MNDHIESNLIDVSIIIPTHNQKDNLREALFSLQELDYPRHKYEVVVIDDNSSDNTEKVIRQLRSKMKYPLVYKKLTRKNGISAARNLGMNLARGRIFLFSDDDCLFEPQWLQLITTPFSSAEVGAVGGPDRSPVTENIIARCIDYIFTSFIGTGGLRGYQKFRLGRYYPKGYNMAVPRKIISETGTFIENLQPGEDIELGYRIEKAGYKLVYQKEAIVWHKRRHSLKKHIIKMFQMGYHRIVLGCLHPGLLQIGHFIPFLGLQLLLLFSILAILLDTALYILLSVLLSYFSMILITSIIAGIKVRDLRLALFLIFLLPVHHFSHAAGVLFALCKLLIKGKSSFLHFMN